MEENKNDSLSEDKKKKDNQDHRKTVLSYLHDLCYLLCGILVVFLLMFRVVVVSGSSMNNTFVDGDYILLLNNVFYGDPEPGDVIVASKESFGNGEPIIKRVIATEGQTVHIDGKNQKVYVDGKLLNEPYIATPTINENFTMTVDKGCVFVMGDNNGKKVSCHLCRSALELFRQTGLREIGWSSKALSDNATSRHL